MATSSGALVDSADDSTPESDAGTWADGFGAPPLVDAGCSAGTSTAEDVGGSRSFSAANISRLK